jgi:hypothetical protein
MELDAYLCELRATLRDRIPRAVAQQFERRDVTGAGFGPYCDTASTGRIIRNMILPHPAVA